MNTTTSEDMRRNRETATRFFASPSSLPVSFVFDEKPVSGIPALWNSKISTRSIDANIHETVFEGTDPTTGLNLRIEYTAYRDFPVIEWVGWLTNHGTVATPVIRDLLALDGVFKGTSPRCWFTAMAIFTARGDIRL